MLLKSKNFLKEEDINDNNYINITSFLSYFSEIYPHLNPNRQNNVNEFVKYFLKI